MTNEDKEKPRVSYDMCNICYTDELNNVDGPGPTRYCSSNCNDVVSVCPGNHMFHRGCIMN